MIKILFYARGSSWIFQQQYLNNFTRSSTVYSEPISEKQTIDEVASRFKFVDESAEKV